jgi:cytochrome b561
MTYGALPGGYPASSKWLHWLVSISVLTMIPVAIVMTRIESGPLQNWLYNFHKAMGVVIFVLMVARLINRIAVGAPAPEPGLERWQRAASSAVHGLLYVLLIAMAVIGYIANSAFGATTPFFGLFEIPPLVGHNEALSNRLFFLHRWMGYLTAALAALHIAAALQHHFVLRDGVLLRMLPRAFGGR